MDYLKEKNIVNRIFNEIQGYPKKQDQFAEILANVYCNDPENFITKFSSCLYTVIGHKGSSKEVENLIQFISTTVSRCTGNNQVPILAPLVIEDLLNYTKAKDRFVRQRCLIIINQILTKSKTLDLEPKLLKKLKSVYIERSRDKVITVRNPAATGLCLLQNFNEPDEEILQLISKNMTYESNTAIRCIYASSIIVHPITMDSIVLRIRDDEISVRLALLKNIELHSVIQQLSITLRHAIVHCLQDRNEIIVKSTENVIIQNWAKNTPVLLLLSLFDLEEEEEIGELVLNALFVYEQKNKTKLFTSSVTLVLTQLSSLTSFYLYSIVRFLFEQQRETEIDEYIPDIPQFCAIVKNCLFTSNISNNDQQLVFVNLIRCLQYLEIADDICKQELLKCIRCLLNLNSNSNSNSNINSNININYDLIINSNNIYVILQALLNILDSETAFLSEISLLVSDIEDMIEDISTSSTSSSTPISLTLSKEKYLLYLLYIVQNTFKLISSAAFIHPEIISLFDQVIRVNLQSPIAELRREAVKGLVLAAIMKKSIVYQYTSLLLCILLEEEEDPEVRLVAIRGLTDIIIVYGDLKQQQEIEHKVSQEEDVIDMGVSIDEIIQSFNNYIFDEHEEVQNTICHSMCKLFMFNKTRSINIFSSLLLLLFDSATEKKSLLRQMLSVFFPSFCNPAIDKNCIFLQETVIYTIKGIAEACIPERYMMLTEMSKALMTVNKRMSEKRDYVISDDEDEDSQEEKLEIEYHRCVIKFIKELVAICETKLDDMAFEKECIAVLLYINEELMTKQNREEFNNVIIELYNKLSSTTLQQQFA